MNKPVIIIGNGGHASVLAEILIAQEREIIGYTDLKKKQDLSHLNYLGTDDVITESYSPEDIELVLGLGTVKADAIRKNLFEYFKSKGFKFTSVVHPTAILSPSVRFGQGAQIMAGSILQSNSSIGDNSIVNTGAIIDHDCQIGKHVHIAPGATLSGGVQIGDCCHIGTGSSIIQGIIIGKETTIGAGATVVKNFGIGKTAYGIPAKEV
ncbi:acetyltransferase [Sporosarcina ureilytica]|uniref:Sugar acetyltransferase n=1 Tax=Sporosarcina ureilytica TaxID=298596 RepID=A0A1D8JII6_9BACL|nr:acetyltransferase [Sporosarcina ureilytica]AOV08503.1 sugar acetyltransferase [Sporosarcina ureilytica]